MVPKSKNIGSESKSGQSSDFFYFLDFWDPDFPNSFRKNRSPMAPQGKPLCGKESRMDPLHVRFSSETVESISFYKSNLFFSWKPCFLRSSVWGQFRQVFVFPPRLLAIYWDTYNLTHWVRSQRTTHDGWALAEPLEQSPRKVTMERRAQLLNHLLPLTPSILVYSPTTGRAIYKSSHHRCRANMSTM